MTMKLARHAAACALLALASATPIVTRAQAHPNFSGRWVIVQPEKGAGLEQVIKHDDKVLTKTPVSERGGPPEPSRLPVVGSPAMLA